MSERWWRRRKRLDPWFGDFEEFNHTENDMNEMVRRVLGTGKPEKKKNNPHTSCSYLELGSDENLRYRKFVNPQSRRLANRVKENREPLVDIIEEGQEVVVVADLHGVKKEEVQIHAAQSDITISVNALECKYHKELSLPAKTDPESAVATYKNGVLQVRLKKLVDTPLYSE